MRRAKMRPFYGSLAPNYTAGGVSLPYNAAFSPGAGSFTLSTWVKVTAASIADANTHAIALHGSDINGWLVSQYAGNLLVYIRSGSARVTLTNFFAPFADKWIHLVIVCTPNGANSSIAVYVDGELHTNTTGLAVWTSITGSYPFDIGATGVFATLRARSNIGHTRFWLQALTAEQVAALHYDDIEPSQPVIDARFGAFANASTTTPNYGSAGGTFTLAAGNFGTYGSTETPGGRQRRPKQNLLRQSNNLSAATWDRVYVTVVASAEAHPTRPGQPVWRMAATTDVNVHVIRQLNLVNFGADSRELRGRAYRHRFLAKRGSGATLGFDFGTYTWATGVWAVTSNAWMVLNYRAVPLGNDWYEFVIDYASDIYKTLVTVGNIYLPATHAATNYVDLCDCSIRELNADNEYVDTTVEPVIATGGVAGAPVGPQNLLVNSAAAASWLPLNADASAQPDGVIRVTERNNTGEHIVYQTPPGNQIKNAMYTVTITARAGTRSWLWIRGPQGGTRPDSAYFDLATGSLGGVNSLAAGASIEPLGSGWYRCSVTFWTTQNAPGHAVCIGPASGDGAYTYAGNGTGYIEFKDAQYTQAAGPSEFVATSGAAANGDAQRGQVTKQNFAVVTSTMHTTWAAQSATLSSPAPDVARVTDTAANAEHIMYLAGAIPNMGNKPVTMSITAKAGTKSWLWMRGYSNVTETSYFDLANGVIGATKGNAVLSQRIEPLGDGWYRCSMTYIDRLNAVATPYFCVGPANGNGAMTYLGDGTGYVDVKEPSWTLTNGDVPYAPNPAPGPLRGVTPRARRPA